jgi:hypothetical protein
MYGRIACTWHESYQFSIMYIYIYIVINIYIYVIIYIIIYNYIYNYIYIYTHSQIQLFLYVVLCALRAQYRELGYHKCALDMLNNFILSRMFL